MTSLLICVYTPHFRDGGLSVEPRASSPASNIGGGGEGQMKISCWVI